MISICLWCYCFFYLHYFMSAQSQSYVLSCIRSSVFLIVLILFHFKEKDKHTTGMCSNVMENVDKYDFEPEVMRKMGEKWTCVVRRSDIVHCDVTGKLFYKLWLIFWWTLPRLLQGTTILQEQFKLYPLICHINSKWPLWLAIWVSILQIVAHSLPRCSHSTAGPAAVFTKTKWKQPTGVSNQS